MIKLLLFAELSDVPIFLAQDTSQLESMQSNIEVLTAFQKDLSDPVNSHTRQDPKVPLRLRDDVNESAPADIRQQPVQPMDDIPLRTVTQYDHVHLPYDDSLSHMHRMMLCVMKSRLQSSLAV